MEVLEGLLRIKRIREESREAEMRGARQRLEMAVQALRRATEEQQRRDRERTEAERTMYDDVCSRLVVVRDLDNLRQEVDLMKEAAKADAQAVTEAQAQRQAKRQAFDETSAAWRLALRAKQKFEDLSAQEREARAAHAEWLADLELEEHAGRVPLAHAFEESAEEA